MKVQIFIAPILGLRGLKRQRALDESMLFALLDPAIRMLAPLFFATPGPILDRVEKMLMHFKRVDQFFKFKKDDLRHYPAYHDVLMEFSRFYGLESFTLKQIDIYLWQAGKDYFPKKY